MNLYAYVANDPVNNADPTGATCTSSQNADGKTVYACKIDSVRYRDASGNVKTRNPTSQEQVSFRRFNREYTRAVNRLAAHPERRGTVPNLQSGKGGFTIRAGESVAVMAARNFVYDSTGEINSGTLLVTSGIYNPAAGEVENEMTYVSSQGLSQATQGGIVHDGGMHSTYQEWTGGLQQPGYPLGKPPLDAAHQEPYARAACRMLGVGGLSC
jgi:hypothetical protein